MAKRQIKPYRPVYPSPAALVASCRPDGTGANLVTLAEVFNVSIARPVIVGIAIRTATHSHGLIAETGEFTINLPPARLLAAVDAVGSVSGRDCPDKFAAFGLTPLPSEKVRPPIVAECPVNLECRVLSEQAVGDHQLLLAEVLVEHVDEDCLTADDRPDPARLDAFSYSFREYYAAGRHLGTHGRAHDELKQTPRSHTMKLEKYEGNPILSPDPSIPWMSRTATNPGAWYDEARGEVILLFRCADWDIAHVRHLAMATSRDGYRFELACHQPVMSPDPDGWDRGALEDPRIVKFDDWYFITYAAFPAPQGEYWDWRKGMRYRPPAAPDEFPAALRRNLTGTGLALTRDFRTFIRAGRMTDPTDDDRDVILFPEKIGGRFWRLSRPAFRVGPEFGCEAPAIWIAASDDVLHWPNENLKLLAKAKYDWEGTKIGANTPPIRTDEGWLVLYHGVSETDRYYRIGAMLLDLEDPSVVLHRTPDWLMEPTEEWEKVGYYNGVVFPCGAVVIEGRLFVYYGGGDIHCAVATCDFAALVDHLCGCPA